MQSVMKIVNRINVSRVNGVPSYMNSFFALQSLKQSSVYNTFENLSSGQVLRSFAPFAITFTTTYNPTV